VAQRFSAAVLSLFQHRRDFESAAKSIRGLYLFVCFTFVVAGRLLWHRVNIRQSLASELGLAR
jgi:hypothetical protein